MSALFVYSDRFPQYSMGESHPMKLIRLALTRDLIDAYGLLDRPGVLQAEALPAKETALRRIHDEDYLEALQTLNGGMHSPGAYRYGLGSQDCPIIPGVWQLSLLSAGASIQCAEAVHQGAVEVGFNIAGGLHHAQEHKASGFCYLNDPAAAIQWLVDQGHRVAYVDIDAHHGDGVQWLFYETDRVLTISLHESGRYLFPGTGFETETGRGVGEGYSVNVPLLPCTDDEVFCWAFEKIVPTFVQAFKPDFIVSQLGCDTFHTDPLTHLDLTTNGFCRMVQRIKELAGGRWIALGGGGYRVGNVPRAWTLAWALMAGAEVSDELPGEFLAVVDRLDLKSSCPEFEGLKRLRDEPYHSLESGACRREAERVVKYLEKEVLPKVLPA
ncbi:MAG: acetoin utilization protein AcuC [Armatimonadetes bacterium]|nr:acetoin utilization protein AcuC [Armatimonadota bacterium]